MAPSTSSIHRQRLTPDLPSIDYVYGIRNVRPENNFTHEYLQKDVAILAKIQVHQWPGCATAQGMKGLKASNTRKGGTAILVPHGGG